MVPTFVECSCIAAVAFRYEFDSTPQPPPEDGRSFVDLHHQAIVVPNQVRTRKCKRVYVARHRLRRVFAEHPGTPMPRIQGQIDGTVLPRIDFSSLPSPPVVRREHRTHEGNQGKGMPAVVGDAVDIPPEVATGTHVRVEWRSTSAWDAANPPLKITIGTPAPG